ncbi:MAG TPA: thiamine diphosphokinase [Clostridiales bacterium]|jgi:thiamine pyrophosphokinase|nr:thiamine diphosphokinase [Clostridiales bacterium]
MNRKDKRCVIVAAGSLYGRKIAVSEGDFVIAADAGYKYCENQNIRYDLLVGDFDSAEKPDFAGEIVVLPQKKDVTDSWQAIEEGVKRGFCEFHIYGGSGSRADHTLANIQSAVYQAERGRRVFIYCEKMIITAISIGCITIENPIYNCASEETREEQPHLGVFCYRGRAEGVNIIGTQYELNNGVLVDNFPLGAANLFRQDSEKVEISVKSGTILVCWQDIL